MKPEVYKFPDTPESPSFETPKRLEEYFGLVRTVSAAPTWIPKNLLEQFAIYKNSTTYRFYWYDTVNGEWRYATGT